MDGWERRKNEMKGTARSAKPAAHLYT